MPKKISESKIFSFILGLILICYGLWDIYEELFEPQHEHILILIGLLLFIHAIGHTFEGINKIMHVISKEKEVYFLNRIEFIFNLLFIRIILGLTVIATSSYGLYQDFEKIHSKSVSIGVGLLLIILPFFSASNAGMSIFKVFRKSD
ncbi:hypothetical protein [Brumimicrobium mesophilum]|uniref:hypothetical protein n=1 Tax=Brumimicrobium mesophilum TaxID=392717 RepID=UPI000D14015E|nr:hypothetical protein [Brumimicrobium mesophilum]